MMQGFLQARSMSSGKFKYVYTKASSLPVRIQEVNVLVQTGGQLRC